MASASSSCKDVWKNFTRISTRSCVKDLLEDFAIKIYNENAAGPEKCRRPRAWEPCSADFVRAGRKSAGGQSANPDPTPPLSGDLCWGKNRFGYFTFSEGSRRETTRVLKWICSESLGTWKQDLSWVSNPVRWSAVFLHLPGDWYCWRTCMSANVLLAKFAKELGPP